MTGTMSSSRRFVNAALRHTRGMRSMATLSLAVIAALVFGAPSVFVAPTTSAASAVSSPWVAGSAAERMQESRGEAEALTQMHGRYPDRSRKNAQGGGRLPIRVQRHPVLGYAQAAGVRANMKTSDLEKPSGVINRMFDMMDMDYNMMQQAFKRYWRPEYRRVKWLGDWKQKRGRRTVQRRIKQRYEEEWAAWMRTKGRQSGLTTPIAFKGPLVPATPEELEIEEWRKTVTPEMLRRKPTWEEKIPYDMAPGKWDDGPTSIFNAWKRPLHKHPYDIGKRGTTHVVRGLVY
eukprot:TRINITY_DN1868_c0_g1_i1.p1 TRINITY_DN1868_c0_g1~~TRINITY_DN1868_c0_g1_i1.p1  ORF type:complete len:290 (+),score=59.25 TRINITY_DN1868_c0_g1_i1:95-964(+)